MPPLFLIAPQVRRILVGGIGAVGNTLLAGPMLACLHERFPDAEIRMAFKSRRGGKLALPHFVRRNRSYVFSLRAGPWHGLRDVLAAACWRPDLIIVPFLTHGRAMQLVSACSPASTLLYHSGGRLRYPSRRQLEVPLSRERHETELYLSLVQPVTGTTAIEEPLGGASFAADAADRQLAEALWAKAGLAGRRAVAFNPFSSAEQAWKRWGGAQWDTFVDGLTAAGFTPVLISSPEEARLLQDWPALLQRRRFHVSLGVSAELIAHCRLAVSCDTGFGHLAAARGVPALMLFGPTDERRARPWGRQHQILIQDLPCRPCYGLGDGMQAASCSHRSCMAHTPETVLAAALRMLAAPCSSDVNLSTISSYHE